MRIVTGLILALVVVLLAISIAWLAIVEKKTPQTWLPSGHVRGSAVIVEETPYTLNFEQQEELVALLRETSPAKRHKQSTETALPKIEIYLFEGRPPLTLTPLNTEYSVLVLSHEGKTQQLSVDDPAALKALVEGAAR